MRPNTATVLYMICVCSQAFAQDVPDEPELDWGDDVGWLDGETDPELFAAPKILAVRQSFSKDHLYFEVEIEMSEPVTRSDEIHGRGTWAGHCVEMRLPFAKLPEGPTETYVNSWGYSHVTVVPDGVINGAKVTWHFTEQRSFPQVIISTEYDNPRIIKMTARREFVARDPNWDGWVRSHGRVQERKSTPNPFGSWEPYELCGISVLEREIRIETSMEELEILYQQTDSSFYAGQFMFRHRSEDGSVLKAVEIDENGRLRPIMAERVLSLPKNTPELTVLFTRGVSFASDFEQIEQAKDEELIGQITARHPPGDSQDIRVSIELPLSCFYYEFWIEGGTLVIRALDSMEFEQGFE
jgi:hypothetical protein